RAQRWQRRVCVHCRRDWAPDLRRRIPRDPTRDAGGMGMHSFPNPSGYRLEDALVTYDAHGRAVSYASAQDSAPGKWLRENPHRLSLGRVGFKLVRADDSPAKSSDLADVRQRLDLWSGKIESTFTLDGRVVRVVTAAHPSRDLIAVRVESAQLDPARLAI